MDGGEWEGRGGFENGIRFYLGASASPHHRSLPPLWPWIGQRETRAIYKSRQGALFTQIKTNTPLLFPIPWNVPFHYLMSPNSHKANMNCWCNWQYSPLRTYWNSPWVQARHSYGGFHLQISSLIYCYRLCCPSERKQGVYGLQCLLKDPSGKGRLAIIYSGSAEEIRFSSCPGV